MLLHTMLTSLQMQQEAWQTFLADMDERINKQKVRKSTAFCSLLADTVR